MNDPSRIRSGRGMPYGGMPADAILERLEVTDTGPAQQRGAPGEGFTGCMHKDYMIGEILDRTPDPGFLESDIARRNPQAAREVLNLRFGGSRGSSGEMPRNPELFLGFTGDDPRGSENLPRFDEMRKQTAHRVRQLEVRMGGSVGHDGDVDQAPHQEAERPWTGTDLRKARTDMHEASRRRLKVFDTAREGRRPVAGQAGWEDAERGAAFARAELVGAGGEHWDAGSPGAGALWRDDRGGGDGLVGVSSGRGSRDPRRAQKLWTAARTAGFQSADLAVARYSQAGRRSRRDAPGADAAHAQRGEHTAQQEFGGEGGSRVGGAAGRQALAVAMTGAAQAGRAAAARDGNARDGARGAELAAPARRRAALAGDADAAAVARLATADPEAFDAERGARQAGGSGAAQAHGVGAALSGATALAGRTLADADHHARVALAAGMSAAARRSSARHADVDTVSAAYAVVADGARQFAPEADAARAAGLAGGRGLNPADSADAGAGGFGAARRQAAAASEALHGAAAAGGVLSATYRGAAPTDSLDAGTGGFGAARRQAAAASEALHGAAAAEGASIASYRGAAVLADAFEARGQGAAARTADALDVPHVARGLLGRVAHLDTPRYVGATQDSQGVVTDTASVSEDGLFGMVVGRYGEAAHVPRAGALAVRGAMGFARADRRGLADGAFENDF